MRRLPDGGVEVTLGTHNLLHGRAKVTPFADVIVFTEADHPLKVRTALATTHRVYRRRAIPGVMIAVRRGLLERRVVVKPHVVHVGQKGFTPRRGTLALEGRVTATGQDVALLGHHRINAAWPPYRFEEPEARRETRKKLWRRHAAIDSMIVADLLRAGFDVLAGGDGNDRRPQPESNVWPTELAVYGTGTDRLAHSGGIAPEEGIVALAKLGSDHHRYRMTVRLYARVNDRPEATR